MTAKNARRVMIACSTLLLTQLACMAEESPFREVTEAFAIGQPASQKGWVAASSITAENWIPIDQKNLAQDLNNAETLNLQDIAPAPRRVSQGHLPYFCPNPDGKSWDILNPYHKKYLSEGQVLVHDFGSGESKLFSYGTSEGSNIITPHSTDFHMKSSYYLAKKMIFVLPATSHGLVFLVYDPAVNDFVSRTAPFAGRFDLYALDIGDDNRLYGMGQPDSKDGFQAFVFDPETYETKIYDINSPTGDHAGPLEEAMPGLVIGHAVDGDSGLLYGLEAATGKLLWRKPVPVGPITSFSRVRRHAYTFRRGPDGFIWASFDDALVRIDPRNAEVIPVGKMEAAQIAFANKGVYAAGGINLRRIEGLLVATALDGTLRGDKGDEER